MIWMFRHVSTKRLGGLLTLGGMDSKNCDEDWTYTNMSLSSAFWSFPLTKMKLGNYTVRNVYHAIINTGESFLLTPNKRILNDIVDQLNATLTKPYNFYTIPCNKISDAPDLTFEIRGKQFSIPGSEYVRDVGFVDYPITNKCLAEDWWRSMRSNH